MREQNREVSAPDAEKCIPEKIRVQIKEEADRLIFLMSELISYSDDVRMMNKEGTRVSLGSLSSDEEAVDLFRRQLEEEPISGLLMGTKVRAYGDAYKTKASPRRARNTAFASAEADIATAAEGNTATSAKTFAAAAADSPAAAAEKPEPAEKPRKPFNDTLWSYMRRHMRLKVPEETVRSIGMKVAEAAEEGQNGAISRSHAGRRGRGRRGEESFLIGGVDTAGLNSGRGSARRSQARYNSGASRRDYASIGAGPGSGTSGYPQASGASSSLYATLGRAALLMSLARRIGLSTKLLHAAAAKYNLAPVEHMLGLYDSIRNFVLPSTPAPATREETATPAPATAEETVTPASATAEETASPAPATPEEAATPAPAAPEETATPAPANAEETATPAPAAPDETATPAPAAPGETTTPEEASAPASHVPDLFSSARRLRRHFIIHVGGTNTGKTHDAMEHLARAKSGVYLCPLRMLAYEGRAVIESYGVPCSFATGEEKEIDPAARHISETIGMLDFGRKYDMAVIDECQLISGEDGSLYTNAILGVQADTVEVCCAYSGLGITKRLITLCGDDYEVIEHHRSSELVFEDEPYRGPRKNDAYIVFSRLGAYEMAAWLEKKGMHPSIVYGKLPYEVKMEEARKFERGDTDCLVATDAIAIGQNYNIERIIFRDTVKHINRREVELDSQTVKQVAGRAGRFGRFPIGYVNTFEAEDRDEIRRKLLEDDVPSSEAPLELPPHLIDIDLPLSLIYKAWNETEVEPPFVKADTTVEMYICRLIEERYGHISRRDEYSLAALPLDLKDKDQEILLDNLLYLYDRTCALRRQVSGMSTEYAPGRQDGRSRGGENQPGRQDSDWGKEYATNRQDGRSRGGRGVSDEEWKLLLPDKNHIAKIVKYRPHMMTLEKLCRNLDLASSFFYKIRREDLASYVIRLKPPITRRIAEIMAEKPEEAATGQKSSGGQAGQAMQNTAGGRSGSNALQTMQRTASVQGEGSAAAAQKLADWQGEGSTPRQGDYATVATQKPSGSQAGQATQGSTAQQGDSAAAAAAAQPAQAAADDSTWPVAYIYVTVSGMCERNTGRYPYGDYSRLYSRELRQSYGNEATYIDYYCYKKKTRTPDMCRFEPYFRYTVKLDPRYIVSDEGPFFLAQKFRVIRSDYMHSASPMNLDRPEINSRAHHYRNNRRRDFGSI